MCGLVGVVNAKKSIVDESKKIRGLLSCIRYRGPDAHKFFADEDAGVILGHCLLAVSSYENLVIQPFLTRSGNVILFNGEIYNFMKLRDCLTEKLSLPDDVSDTVILSMYIEQYGIHEFLKKAVGMYCIVFWDKINSLMYFARDKFGQKPLFFTEESDKLYFCSELNPLINTLQKPQINKETVEQLLTLGFSVDTPFKNVFELKPGQLLCYNLHDKKFNNAGNVEKRNRKRHEIKSLESVFSEIISETITASRPSCVLLSGGLDSSTILAWTKKITGRSLDSVTIGFESQYNSETSRALSVSSDLKSKNNLIIFPDEEVEETFKKFVVGASQPMVDPAFMALTYLCDKMKNNYVVGLTGDGADELSGGYYRYNVVDKIAQYPILFNKLSMLLGPLIYCIPGGSERLRKLGYLFSLMNKNRLKQLDLLQLLACSSLHPNLEELTLRSIIATPEVEKYNYQDLLNFEQKYYLPSLLAKSDRASMRSSVELRSPFLDDRLYHYISSASVSDPKLLNSKHLVKKLLHMTSYGYLLNYPKKGFEIPLREWLVGPLSGQVEHIINSREPIIDNLIHKNVINSLYTGLNDKNGFKMARFIYHYISIKSWMLKNA